jgi:hypothetical protein
LTTRMPKGLQGFNCCKRRILWRKQRLKDTIIISIQIHYL